MANISRFAAVNTKVKVMEGQLLKKDDYLKLLESNSIEELIEYIKNNTWYGSKMTSEQELSIVELEGFFRKNVFEKYEKLFHYFYGEYKRFFKILFMRYEIENIKVFLRMIVRKESLERVTDHIIIPNIYSRIDYKLLNDARTIDDLIAGLEGTDYQKIISMFKDEEPDKLMFYMEMNLDRYYFKRLISQAKRLESSDSRAVSEVLGRNIDLLNIQWIYRGRRFYKISQEELINYTLTGGKFFGYQRLKDMCYKDRLEDIESMVRTSQYGFLFDDAQDFDIFFESIMERYIYNYFSKLKKEHVMSIVEPLHFMHQLEYEMRDLFSIVETKRYGLPPEESAKYLVRDLT